MKVTKQRARLWRNARAAFVVFHVLAVLLLSLPSGHSLADRKRWKNHRTQSEFKLWANRLRGWGVDTDTKRLDEQLWSSVQGYLRVQRVVAEPFRHYDRFGGMSQGWGMFRSPQRRPAMLRVEVFEAHRWHTVYLSRSSEHRFLATQLDHNRIRKLIGRSARSRAIFEQLASWIARRIPQEFPRARRARISLERFDSLTPAERTMGKTRKLVLQYRRNVDLDSSP